MSSMEKGFRLGIDDYMVKPLNMDLLALRVGAILRRAGIANDRRLSAGGLVMDAHEVSVTVDGEEIAVTTREFNVHDALLPGAALFPAAS